MDSFGIKGLHTKKLGERFLWFDRLGSTNDYLKEHGPNLPDGTVAATAEQYEGKGRLGRSWNVPRGETVAMSVLFPLLRAGGGKRAVRADWAKGAY